MTDPLPTVRIDRNDPAFRAAVTAAVDARLHQIADTWAAHLDAAGYPDAATLLRQQVTP